MQFKCDVCPSCLYDDIQNVVLMFKAKKSVKKRIPIYRAMFRRSGGRRSGGR